MTEVLVCVDFSESTAAVMREAVSLARAFGAGLHIIHVAGEEPIIAGYDRDPMGAFTRDERAKQLLEEHHELRGLAEQVASDGVPAKALVAVGDTVEEILEEADRLGATHIVVGSHGQGGLLHRLLGSVSEALITRSPCPIVVVPIGER